MTSGEAGPETGQNDRGAPPQGGVLTSALTAVLSGLNTVGSAWILVLVLLINADAFGRKLFAHPIDGVIEITELSLVGIIFLQLGDATRRGKLTRSDGFFGIVQHRRPTVGRCMGAAFDLLGVAFMALILYGSVPLLLEAIEEDFYVGVQGLVTIPVWPVKLVVVVGALVTGLQFLVFAVRYLRPVVAGGGRS